jgi:membrane associated rhomboid family serine protease
LIPLKDNIPTSRFPVVTVVLIAINVAVFVWQTTLPGEVRDQSSPELRALGVPPNDEAVLEYGAIPNRITHPGEECAVGAVGEDRRLRSAVVCEGSAEFDRAEELSETGGAPLVPLAAAAWWLTIVTSMFMHGGLLHIAGNMLFLWVFGNNIEDSMGRLRFIAFYLLAGAIAVYAQALLDPSSTTPTIGASGAVAGVLGGYLVLHPQARVVTLVIIIFFVTIVEIPALILLGLWFALQFLPAAGQVATQELGGEGIAYLAHVGGFVFGLLAIKLFTARRRTRPRLGFG